MKKFKAEPTAPERRKIRQRFAEAIHYARQAMTDSKVRAHYEKLGRRAGRQPFRVAVSDSIKGIEVLEK